MVNPGRYTIQASAAQMAVLLKYNERKSYSCQELTDRTAIPMDAVIPVIEILVRNKLLIPEGSPVDNLTSGTVVALNSAFQNKKLRFSINIPVKAELEAEKQKTKDTIEDDRKHLVGAAIVRIMKTRKQMEHQQLIKEVFAQLTPRFKPDRKLVKKCIETLIEKEYIERKADENQTYCYLV